MALPVGHGLVGIAIGKKTNIHPTAAFILASLPDVDFFFGLYLAGGNMLALHRDPLTHSPLFALFVALFFWLWARIRKLKFTIRQVVGIFLIVASHWAVDFYMPLLPYAFDFSAGQNGLLDFLTAYIVTPLFIYNNLVDLVVYGSLYLVVVKFIYRDKKLI